MTRSDPLIRRGSVRWSVEVTATTYSLVEVEAATEDEARQKALAGEGNLVGTDYTDGETHKVERL